MIRKVYLHSFTANELPYKFEGGTSPVAEIIGFGAAVDYLNKIGMNEIASYESKIIQYALGKLMTISGLTVLGPEASMKGSVAAFQLKVFIPMMWLKSWMKRESRCGQGIIVPCRSMKNMDWRRPPAPVFIFTIQKRMSTHCSRDC